MDAALRAERAEQPRQDRAGRPAPESPEAERRRVGRGGPRPADQHLELERPEPRAQPSAPGRA
eukprot:311807-Alexandrium_andersonii.AAC.1